MLEPIEADVLHVLHSCRGLIPDEFLAEDIDLASAREWGIALENLCSQLDDVAIDEVTFKRIERLGTQMRLEPDYWLRLKRKRSIGDLG